MLAAHLEHFQNGVCGLAPRLLRLLRWMWTASLDKRGEIGCLRMSYVMIDL